jgi:hypothetical protein
MCSLEGASLQLGMNFRLSGDCSVVLMSRRPGAPYEDRVEDDGRVLIYEGHDQPRVAGGRDPKTLNQVLRYPSGRPTQNGRFFEAALAAKTGRQAPDLVRVYEKILRGIWVFTGTFALVDAWIQKASGREVIKFRMELLEEEDPVHERETVALAETHDQPRVIPTEVKLAVWKRDRGRCVLCGSTANLHFDHIIPYSLGGSSTTAENIQLLCATHNLGKGASIQ